MKFLSTEQQEEIVSAMVNQDLNKEESKYSGYSGWSPYQLDQEVQNKMWTVVESFQLDYTSPNDQTSGKNHTKSRRRLFALGHSPEDVSLNL